MRHPVSTSCVCARDRPHHHPRPRTVAVTIVKSRIWKPDVKERWWLLDGYPRTAAQAQSLERLGIRPDFCVVLDVSDQILVDRCVGRRLDPVTRKIYHVEYDTHESEEVNVRLIIRTDDSVEKTNKTNAIKTVVRMGDRVEECCRGGSDQRPRGAERGPIADHNDFGVALIPVKDH
ncbi:hypothetical protein QJS10_CPB18g01112 [Acorus calamus]|uniref:adenylate kinase n=1 Tax=Acorus calamus TaxID=4465 RepID=A0AAV9CPS5_ACOCL|nr:hypothetical protein QJS10_CPB18g01112 [Acorus calamus]